MKSSLRHIALVVADLQAAEQYYQTIFNLELLGREAELDDGLWYTLPFDKNWQDAIQAGIDLDMVALRGGDFVLALFAGEATRGQVFAIGLNLPSEQIAEVRSRLPAKADILADQSDYLEFCDPNQIRWQISTTGSEFRTAGEIASRWFEI